MSLYTPNGLKIRLDEDGVKVAMEPLRIADADFKTILLKVELWANFPSAVSNVTAILVSLLTASWWLVMVSAICAFAVGELVAGVTYSTFLRRLFPEFFGGWLIAMPASILTGVWAWSNQHYALAIILVAIALANWAGLLDYLLLPLLLVTAPIKRLLRVPMGLPELAFMAISTQEALKAGVELNWLGYDRLVQGKKEQELSAFLKGRSATLGASRKEE